ncbi:unnamed protein product [Miscanthus lutarioriparius]|uniref:GAG-pre-integrase domain-containing protein n=1 Tax=Miscanthus lutarioriparius TaxID=422564 RepID=A0A811RL17_9POAL|nr:unnamed protein product [Miscanthus lutarioriparius]
MKRQADKHRSKRQFSVGDQILARIGAAAYKLELPTSSSIHPVFDVSRLKASHGSTSHSGSSLDCRCLPSGGSACAVVPDAAVPSHLGATGSSQAALPKSARLGSCRLSRRGDCQRSFLCYSEEGVGVVPNSLQDILRIAEKYRIRRRGKTSRLVRNWFSSYKPVQKGDVVRMGDDNPCDIVGIGSVQIKTDDGMTRTLKNVRYIPGMSRNLISLSTLDAEGYKYSGSDGVLKVSKGSLVCLKGDLNSAKLYVLRGCTLPGSDSAVAAVTNDEPSKTNLWHMRLGHMSHHGMAELMKRNLLDGCTSSKIKFCEHCIFGKHKRVHFNTSVHTTKGTLDYVHADLWGPSRKSSLGGARYMLTIIDDYSRRVWPYFLKQKDDTFAAFKDWKVMIERQTERKIMFQKKELRQMRMQVEHVDDDTGVRWSLLMSMVTMIMMFFEDDAHDDVQQTPPILQLEEDLPIAQRKSKRTIAPPKRLIEECNLSYYALSCL